MREDIGPRGTEPAPAYHTGAAAWRGTEVQLVHEPVDRAQANPQSASGRVPVGQSLLRAGNAGSVVFGLDLHASAFHAPGDGESDDTAAGMFNLITSQFT